MWLICPHLHALDSSACAAAQACSMPPLNSPGTMSLESGREFWVTLKGKPSRQASSWPGWKKRAWSQRLFSAATSATWTPDLCGMNSASLPQVCPASPTAPQENREVLKMLGAGALETAHSHMRCASSKKVSPPWSVSKMCRSGSRVARSVNLAKRYALWVMRSKTRSSSVRAMWAQAIGESESSSWPTCRANEAGSSYQRDRGEKGRERLTLNGLTRGWRTPRCNTGPSTDAQHLSLDGQAREWPTPMSRDSDASGGPGFATLPRKVKEWPTPDASIGLGNRISKNPPGTPRESGAKASIVLNNAVAWWPTPAARDDRAGANSVESLKKRSAQRWGLQLPNFIIHCLPPALSPETGPASSIMLPGSPRHLNPAFVCWLMGWPWHWTRPDPTSFGAEATALWWARQQQALCIFSNG